MTHPPGRITIAGLGLMGGSLARALAHTATPPLVIGVDPDPAARDAARADGVIAEEFASIEDAPPSDLLVLAMRVATIIDTLRDNGDTLRRHTSITDVGSVKLAVHEAAVMGGVADRLAGSHPLCGDHVTGYAASRASLYEGSTVYVVTESPPTPRAAATAVWMAVGAHVVDISAAAHDELVARTSHLPQVVASALAAALAHAGLDPADLGSGGRDTTRIAASDAALWCDVLLHNRHALADPLARMEVQLAVLSRAIIDADATQMLKMLEQAALWRRRIS